jgi:uncharacterized protein (DUF58 family)
MDDAGWIANQQQGQRLQQLLLGAAALIVLALAIDQALLVALGVLLAVVVLVAWLWDRLGLRNVRYSRTLSAARAFPGDEVTLELTVENAKLLPLPWLEILDDVPAALDYVDLATEPAAKPRVVVARILFALGPYQRVRRRYRVRCTARGARHFGPARLTTGDVFGLATRTIDVPDDTILLVYPRLLPLPALGLPVAEPFGDARPRRSLVEDPLQPAGVRPYVPGDAPRLIHWRASARSSTIQTRRHERLAAPTLAVFLDVNTFEHFWEGTDPQRLELAISAAASLAAHGLNEGRQVGLFVNAPLEGGQRFVRIRPSRHPGQLPRLLEALTLLVPYTGFRIEALLNREARRLPPNATVVVVTGHPTRPLEDTLATLHRAGHALVLVTIGSQPTLPDHPGFRTYRLREDTPIADLAAFERT